MKFERIKRAALRVDLLMALAKCIAVLLSYLAGAYITGTLHDDSKYFGAMLACIASVIVLQDDVKNTVHQGWLRILGTFVGAVIGVLYLMMFKFTIVGLVVSTFIVAAFSMFIAIPDNGRIAVMTLVIILFISKVSPDLKPSENGLLRFTEATAGSLIGMGLAWGKMRLLTLYTHTRRRSSPPK